MPDYSGSLEERARSFCAARGIGLIDRLGFGKDGTVWITTDATALKVHERRRTYQRERDVYARLAERGVNLAAGHAIPLIRHMDDAAGIIEMSIVRPPFVLDFASAQIDQPFDFPDDVMTEWFAEKREQFGADWPKAVAVLRALERLGIYMTDVHPGNIKFR